MTTSHPTHCGYYWIKGGKCFKQMFAPYWQPAQLSCNDCHVYPDALICDDPKHEWSLNLFGDYMWVWVDDFLGTGGIFSSEIQITMDEVEGKVK